MSKLYFQRTLKNSVDWRDSVRNAKQNCQQLLSRKGTHSLQDHLTITIPW